MFDDDHKRRGPNWNNHIMKKFGQSIRDNIAEAFVPFAKAHVIVKKEKDNVKAEAVKELMIRNLNKETIH